MRRRTTSFAAKELSEISATPLIDISMLLLVTFLITYPLLEQGIHVNLPKGKAAELTQQQTRNISLNLQGEIFLDNQPTTLEELQQNMEIFGRTIPDLTVFVRADKDLRYEKVMEIMRLLHTAGITRVALITRAE